MRSHENSVQAATAVALERSRRKDRILEASLNLPWHRAFVTSVMAQATEAVDRPDRMNRAMTALSMACTPHDAENASAGLAR